MPQDENLDLLVDELFQPMSQQRQILERVWYRNILYYMGEQWLSWLPRTNSFVKAHQYDRNIPTPVSNICRDFVRSLRAMFINKQYTVKVWPNSNDRDDRQAAELGEELLRDLEARNDFRSKDEAEDVALWLALAGTAFLRDFPAMDRGMLLGDKKTRAGEVATQSIMPFCVYVDDTAGTRLFEKRKVGIQSLKHKDWVKDRHSEFNQDTSSEEAVVNYQRTLMDLVGQVAPWKSSGLEAVSTGGPDSDDLVLYREIEFAPCSQHKEGRYVVYCNGQILEDQKRLPIKVDTNGNWMYTLEDFHYNRIPGRFWSDAAMNDLISPQNTINKIDQSLEMNRSGMGRPMVITTKEMGLKRLTKAGSSFLALEYDPTATAGQVPQIVQGRPLPSSVFTERQLQKDTAQDSAGDPKGVLRGKTPSSNASGIMVDILRETAEQTHTPDVERFYRSMARSYRKRLIVAQEIFTEKRMIKIAGSQGKVSVKHFTGADLRGNTDVRLELTTGLSTTNAGKVQTIVELLQGGMFNQGAVDPEVRDELLRRMGIATFENKVSADRNRAESENSQTINGVLDFYIEVEMTDPETGGPVLEPMTGDPIVDPQTGMPPMVPVVDDPLFELDDHAIHAEVHRRFIISPEFMDLEEKSKTVIMAHFEAHQRRVQQMIEAQKQEAMEAEMVKHMPAQPPQEDQEAPVV